MHLIGILLTFINVSYLTLKCSKNALMQSFYIYQFFGCVVFPLEGDSCRRLISATVEQLPVTSITHLKRNISYVTDTTYHHVKQWSEIYTPRIFLSIWYLESLLNIPQECWGESFNMNMYAIMNGCVLVLMKALRVKSRQLTCRYFWRFVCNRKACS